MDFILQNECIAQNGALSFKEIINAVNHHFCLPAIQRGVVWKRTDIAKFFDSLFKGYPIGNVLFWKLETIEDRTATDYYSICTAPESNYLTEHIPIPGFRGENTNRYCLIDGQQRVTALFRGLTLSYQEENSRYYLYFNALYSHNPDCGAFKYLKKDKDISEDDYWIKVITLWDYCSCMDKIESFCTQVHCELNNKIAELNALTTKKNGQPSKSRASQNASMQIQHLESSREEIIQNCKYFYMAFTNGSLPYHRIELNAIYTNDDIPTKLFNAFVRLNDGGRPLDPTDFLFAQLATNNPSIGTGVDRIVDLINTPNHNNSARSKFTKKNILRLIWLLKRNNNTDSFNRFFLANAQEQTINENELEKIKSAIIKAKEAYIEGGLSFNKRISYDSFLPIAYYYYYNGRNTPKAKKEISRYFETSIMSEAYGHSTDDVMSKVVAAFNQNNTLGTFQNREFDFTRFISAYRYNGGKRFDINEADITNILQLNFVRDKERIKHILILLAIRKGLQPNDINNYDLDHMHPRKYATQNSYNDVNPNDTEAYNYYRAHVNDISNLQLLALTVNRAQKNDMLLKNWLMASYESNDDLLSFEIRNSITENEPFGYDFFDITNFKNFLVQRKKTLKNDLTSYFEIISEQDELSDDNSGTDSSDYSSR